MEGEGQAIYQSHIGEGQVKESSNIIGQSGILDSKVTDTKKKQHHV